MKLAQTREARALALAAVRRGLLAPEALWDMACRWTLGGAASPRELLAGVLPPEQLDDLAQDPGGAGPAFAMSDGASGVAPERGGFETLTYGVPPSDAPAALEPREARYDLGDALGAGGVG